MKLKLSKVSNKKVTEEEFAAWRNELLAT